MWAILGFPVSKWTFADSKDLIQKPPSADLQWQKYTQHFFLVKQNPNIKKSKEIYRKPHEVEDRNLRIHH